METKVNLDQTTLNGAEISAHVNEKFIQLF